MRKPSGAARTATEKPSTIWAQVEHAEEHNRVVLRFLTGDEKLEHSEESEKAAATG